MLGDDLCLVMLTVENERYKEYQFSSLSQRLFRQIIKKKGNASAAKHLSQHETRRRKELWIANRFEVSVFLDLVDKDRLVLVLDLRLLGLWCLHR